MSRFESVLKDILELAEFCGAARGDGFIQRFFCAAKPYLLSLFVSSADSRLISLFAIFLGLESGYYVPSFCTWVRYLSVKVAVVAVEVSISYKERQLISTRMLDASSARFSEVLGSLNLVS